MMEFDDELLLADVDTDVVYIAKSSISNRTFHMFEDCDCSNGRLREKDPSALYDDLTMCRYCRYKLEQ